MKKIALLLLIASATFTACKKEQRDIVTVNTKPTPVDTSMVDTPVVKLDNTYIINGLADMHIGTVDSMMIPLELMHVGGEQHNVTLSVDGLPNNTMASFMPASGIPGFSTTLMLHTFLAKKGTYPITITGTSAAGMKRSYTVNLEVKEEMSCSSMIASLIGSRNFITGMVDTPGVIHMDTRISTLLNSNDETLIFLENLYLEDGDSTTTEYFISYTNREVRMEVNCDDMTVTIPQQSVQGVINTPTPAFKDYTISGSGKIDPETKMLKVEYTVTDRLGFSFDYMMYVSLER